MQSSGLCSSKYLPKKHHKGDAYLRVSLKIFMQEWVPNLLRLHCSRNAPEGFTSPFSELVKGCVLNQKGFI